MVIAKLNIDAILFKPDRSKATGDMVKEWQSAINWLKERGITPKHQILDNVISSDYKKAIKKNNTTYQLVPRHKIDATLLGTGLEQERLTSLHIFVD